MIARLNRDLVDPRTYTRIAYLLLAGVLGTIEFVFLVTALSTGVGLAVTLVGIPILIASVYAWGWLAEIERSTIGALTGKRIASPYRPLPEGGWWDRLRARLADPATWKDLTFLFLQFPFGLLSLIVATTVLSVAVGSLTLPFWYWAIPDGVQIAFAEVDAFGEALAFVPLGALLIWVGIPALGGLGRFYGAYAELLLGSNEDPAVTAEMSDLRDARSRIIEAADAERRRIERDLHDGAQQRLVALSLNLRMAEKRAAEGDPAAAELVRSAGEEAGLALKELRDLARGIHPAILTNRGLAAALDDLAGRASVPVEIVAVPPGRLPDQVESAAYFLVSECLANVDKHAEATRATVAVTVVDDEVEVVVKDDGVGGAELGNGSGLQGLEDRVGSLDGCVDVESPQGGGTTVMATIPLIAGAPAASRPVLTEEQVHALAERRRRGLRYRLIALGTIAFVILAIWGLTGAPNAWPVWPVLSLAFIAALDAWRVFTEPAGGFAGARRLPKTRRRLIATAGTLAIVNLFLVGIWIASGSDYFWPAWVMLGSVVALALKAIPWSHAWHDRLHGTTPPVT
ncbi:MAG TPA: sensor domain-containing protein [Thermoleophilaceae bacterium]|nr:sensor domain-containing protein [Thermoleophilaceae bacterium]